MRRYRAANPTAYKDWVASNRHVYNSAKRLRKAGIKQATPPWASRQMILSVYRACDFLNRTSGARWHVDHIVPLRSKFVCGLHNEFNLQILPELENLAKSNRYVPG